MSRAGSSVVAFGVSAAVGSAVSWLTVAKAVGLVGWVGGSVGALASGVGWAVGVVSTVGVAG